MSNIDTQIKALLLKKKKIDYIKYISDLIKHDLKCIDFKDIQKEIVSKIEPFLLKLSEAIEGDSEVNISDSNLFTPDEQKVLKLVASKALIKTTTVDQIKPIQAVKTTVTPPKPEAPYQDKMNFALTNRHLGNKRVQVMNDENVTIHGVVVGLDAPDVVVKTDTGPTIQVPLNKVVLL